MTPIRQRRPSAPRWFALAALFGATHTAITAYWALGGTGLLWTMGSSFVAKFSDAMWVLYPLALVKALGAFLPPWWDRHGWPLRRLTRFTAWTGSGALVAWGGANTIVGNAVLFGVIHPNGGFERSSMIGHAWIWDPLFLAWGITLASGLWATRRTRSSAH